jgi:hypothetical protein
LAFFHNMPETKLEEAILEVNDQCLVSEFRTGP